MTVAYPPAKEIFFSEIDTALSLIASAPPELKYNKQILIEILRQIALASFLLNGIQTGFAGPRTR